MLDKQQKARYDAFWKNEAVDRCLLYIGVYKDPQGEQKVFHPGEPLSVKWTDLDHRVQTENKTIDNTTYYGDGFPSVFTNFGPGSLAACISGKFDLGENTIWFDKDPIITDWESYPEIKLDQNSEMWHLQADMTAKLCKAGSGKYYTSIADIGGPLDILAALRGSQNLLYDLYDYP